MKTPGIVLFLSLTLPALLSCGSSQEDKPPNLTLPTTAIPYLRATGPNILPVTVGGSSLCGQAGYLNEPCVSVKVCVPGTAQCQTISDILLDTGSVGLRVFSSALTLNLTQNTDSAGNTIAECAQFGIGSDWGPLATADVILGGEPAVTVPIQIIDKTFAPAPQECNDADPSPQSAGFNGILGIGPFNEDCGTTCAVSAAAHAFFSCAPRSGGGGAGGSPAVCNPIALSSSEQPQNPVAALPSDNNGVLLALDQVPLGGSPEVSGILALGIGTRSNNSPTGVFAYTLNGQGNFTTQFNGKSYSNSFVDSGSNGVFVPNTIHLPTCPENDPAGGFFCPASTQVLTATNLSTSGNARATVNFAIGNANTLAQSTDLAFVELSGPSSSGFDWGLPFFYGRAVFEGIENKNSVLGAGPLLGY